MNCLTARSLLVAYLDNELHEHERALVDDHLATCPACVRELRALESTQKRTRATFQAMAMAAVSPAHARERLHARLFGQPHGSSGILHGDRPKGKVFDRTGWVRGKGVLNATALVLVILIVGLVASMYSVVGSDPLRTSAKRTQANYNLVRSEKTPTPTHTATHVPQVTATATAVPTSTPLPTRRPAAPPVLEPTPERIPLITPIFSPTLSPVIQATATFMPTSPTASPVIVATITVTPTTTPTPEIIPATIEPIPATSEPVPATSIPLPATSEPIPATSIPLPATSVPIPTTPEPIPATPTDIPVLATPPASPS